MDLHTALQNALYLMLTVLLPITVKYVAVLLEAKTKEYSARLKDAKVKGYLNNAMTAITSAVTCVSQEYVDQLKFAGKFDETSQKVAKERAVNLAKNLMTEDVKDAIDTLFSDYNEFINVQIEKIIKESKTESNTEK